MQYSYTTVMVSACQLHGLISPYHLDKRRKEGLCCKPGKEFWNSWRPWFVAIYLKSYCLLIRKLKDNYRMAITLFICHTKWVFLPQTGWLLFYRLRIASFCPFPYLFISQNVLFCSILRYFYIKLSIFLSQMYSFITPKICILLV